MRDRRRGIAALALPLSLALSYPYPAGAAPLDDAVALVLAYQPVLQAEADELDERSRQRNWSADLVLGYAEKGTDKEAEGVNAAVRVTIPLFDRKRELETASARAALQRERDTVLAAFLADTETLAVQATHVEDLNTLRAFQRDRLAYREKQVKEGMVDAKELWPMAETVQRAEQEHRRESVKYQAMLDRVARRYGGEEWKRLRDLLAASAKPTKR